MPTSDRKLHSAIVDGVLPTKLHIPAVRGSWVSRPRLLEKLDAGLDARVTLVSAPPGFGKTSLVAEWAGRFSQEEGEPRCAWLSLDHDDNDISRFFAHLLAAIRTLEPTVGVRALAILRESPELAAASFVHTLISDLAGGSALERPMVLVLDDYHSIQAQSIHDTVAGLISQIPSTLHLILIARADPPIQLARLRAQGELAEIRQSDLRFSDQEAALFLNRVMGLELRQEDLVSLETRTEGWIAGLQLAAVALRSSAVETGDRRQFVAAFAGTHRHIADYLVEEVLDRQPPDIQEFLLKTSVMDRFCGPLCNAVLFEGKATREAGDSAAILERLEAENLFLVPLDSERCWYRYHHLFRDLLRFRLKREYPDLVPGLHRRASRWFEAADSIEEAISHALIAEDFDHAASLIEDSAHHLFSNGKMMTLANWLSALPNDVIRARVPLFLAQSWVLLRTGRHKEVEAELLKGPLGFEEAASETELGELAAIHAWIAYLQGEFNRSIEYGAEALHRLPQENLFIRMPALSTQAWAHEARGDIKKATDLANQTITLARRADSLTGLVAGLGHVAQLYAVQGLLTEAESAFAEAVECTDRRGAPQLPLLGMAYIAMGLIRERQDDLQSALHLLRKGIELCRAWAGLTTQAIRGWTALVRILGKQGRSGEACDARREALDAALQHDAPPWAIHPLEENSDSVDPTQSSSSGQESLTRRELDVLQAMSRGLSSGQIAEELFISVSTVRTHLKRIYAKLDAHSRHEALSNARLIGLI